MKPKLHLSSVKNLLQIVMFHALWSGTAVVGVLVESNTSMTLSAPTTAFKTDCHMIIMNLLINCIRFL